MVCGFYKSFLVASGIEQRNSLFNHHNVLKDGLDALQAIGKGLIWVKRKIWPRLKRSKFWKTLVVLQTTFNL